MDGGKGVGSKDLFKYVSKDNIYMHKVPFCWKEEERENFKVPLYYCSSKGAVYRSIIKLKCLIILSYTIDGAFEFICTPVGALETRFAAKTAFMVLNFRSFKALF